MEDSEKKYWLGFSGFFPIGPKRFELLLKYFGSAKIAWEGKREDFLKIGFRTEMVDDLIRYRQEADLSSYILRMEKLGVKSITLEDKNYPENLKRVDSPPYIVYVIGEMLPEDALSLGVVGTRNITSYGKEVTGKLVGDLVANGVTIVSGLCYGVDLIAHQTAIEMGGRTIGVWAGGLDTIDQGFRKLLIEKIIDSKSGAIVSTFPLGFHPMRTTFPQRNRIISGLSLGVLVTEAADDSGSLITADYAVKQKRKVFAVPGPITSSLTAGTAKLLKSKAILVYSVKDILTELDIEAKINKVQSRKILPESKEEKIIVKVLNNEELSMDEIARQTGMEISKVIGLVTIMEMKGIIKNLGGSIYSLTR